MVIIVTGQYEIKNLAGVADKNWAISTLFDNRLFGLKTILCGVYVGGIFYKNSS